VPQQRQTGISEWATQVGNKLAIFCLNSDACQGFGRKEAVTLMMNQELNLLCNSNEIRACKALGRYRQQSGGAVNKGNRETVGKTKLDIDEILRRRAICKPEGPAEGLDIDRDDGL